MAVARQGLKKLSIKNPNAKFKVIRSVFKARVHNGKLDLTEVYVKKRQLVVSSNTTVHTYFNYRSNI